MCVVGVDSIPSDCCYAPLINIALIAILIGSAGKETKDFPTSPFCQVYLRQIGCHPDKKKRWGYNVEDVEVHDHEGCATSIQMFLADFTHTKCVPLATILIIATVDTNVGRIKILRFCLACTL